MFCFCDLCDLCGSSVLLVCVTNVTCVACVNFVFVWLLLVGDLFLFNGSLGLLDSKLLCGLIFFCGFACAYELFKSNDFLDR